MLIRNILIVFLLIGIGYITDSSAKLSTEDHGTNSVQVMVFATPHLRRHDFEEIQ